MTVILDFLNTYWYLILGVFYLITLVINIVSATKYKTSSNLVNFQEVFNLVNEAESLFPGEKRGAEKLAYVISKANNLAPEKVLQIVELILNSPQKK